MNWTIACTVMHLWYWLCSSLYLFPRNCWIFHLEKKLKSSNQTPSNRLLHTSCFTYCSSIHVVFRIQPFIQLFKVIIVQNKGNLWWSSEFQQLQRPCSHLIIIWACGIQITMISYIPYLFPTNKINRKASKKLELTIKSGPCLMTAIRTARIAIIKWCGHKIPFFTFVLFSNSSQSHLLS